MKNKTLSSFKRAMCIGLVGFLAQTSVLTAAFEKPAVKVDQPNIIFILTDDQGYGDLQRHGHPYLQTPNTNRLYDESVRFDHFYVSPSCSPTRAALMTGMHEFRNGVTHTLIPREHLNIEAVTLPDLLKTAGYKTAFIGKWHLGGGVGYAPNNRGFDWCATNPMGPRKHFDPEIIRNGVRTQREGFREDIFFDEAMTFIDESRDQPFFCYLATYSPHTPLAAPEKFITPFLEQGLSEKHAAYLAMVENVDYNVGRLLAFLEERELDENTILIFMNDNGVTEGLDVYNAGMRGCKATAWEGGTRAMSFWRWPNNWKPQTVENLTAHVDVLPTLCELAGVNMPAEVQAEIEGFSLMPLLESEQALSWNDDRMLFHHVGRWPSGLAEAHKYAMVSAHKGDYLLVRSAPCGDLACEDFQSQCTTMRAVYKGLTKTTYADGTAQMHWGTTPMGHWALYNVKEDPACQDDISRTHPELVASMAAAYDNWWDDLYPTMIERGGDLGDPLASAHASARAKKWKGPVSDSEAKGQGAVPQVDAMSRFDRIDENGDSKITKEEYVAPFMNQISVKDLDHDGQLSAEELNVPHFKSVDADNNGQLTSDEIKDFYEQQFKSMDRDQSGSISADEI